MMVGEIRDRETAEIAVQGSQTGHLWSTLYLMILPVRLHVYWICIEPYLISSSLIGVLAQRLVRLNCNTKLNTSR